MTYKGHYLDNGQNWNGICNVGCGNVSMLISQLQWYYYGYAENCTYLLKIHSGVFGDYGASYQPLAQMVWNGKALQTILVTFCRFLIISK